VASGGLHLLSSGKDANDSYFLEATASGDDAFIVTRERLSAWDIDENYDLYDARVGGGFPDPAPAPAPCSGDTCRNAPSGAPTDPTAGSASLIGPGNQSTHRSKPRKCSKNQRKVRRNGKARCVRKKNKRANANRRAGR
jgi:hypothetical protein